MKVRQPKDAEVIAYLDVRLRHLAPNHGYDLQRAVDPIDAVTADVVLQSGCYQFVVSQ